MRDLCRKAGDDAAASIGRLAFLLRDPTDMMMIAISAAGSAIGAAAGYSERASAGLSPDERCELMWAILRPIALAVLGGDSADFQKLLSMCRDTSEVGPE